jgi:competence ComEA-like helix-hairpin-helix protein
MPVEDNTGMLLCTGLKRRERHTIFFSVKHALFLRAETLRRKDMKRHIFVVIGILAVILVLGAVSCDQQGQQAQTEPGMQEEDQTAQAPGEQQMEGQQAMPLTPIDVNTATAEELAMIPGLDRTLAQNIIDYREANGPFASVDDLSRVTGMDQQTLDSIRGWITVGEGGGALEQAPGQMPGESPGQMPEQGTEGSPGGGGI